MRKIICNFTLFSFFVLSIICGISKAELDINEKVAKLDINTATLDDVIKIFGEPEKYLWSDKTFTKDNLPGIYIANYPDNFGVVIASGLISELRFHSQSTGFIFRNKIRIGSSLDDMFDVVGRPSETEVGEKQQKILKNNILYKDIDDRKGFCYYSRPDKGVRFFFYEYKVSAIYVTKVRSSTGRSDGSLQTVRPIQSVKEFDDVRWKDMSKLDLSGRKGLIATLNFNQETVWP